MDATTIAIAIDLAGWGLWFPLTRALAAGPVERWLTVDYYVSTALLALSTLCTLAGAFLGDPVLATRVAVPPLLVGLGILVVRSLRSSARTVQMQHAAAAARPQPPRAPAQPAPVAPQWREATAPPPEPSPRRPAPRQTGGLFSDPLIQDIEARRMTA